ncbi:uncharacterized protein LOC141879385 isoform X2 [Acropora palmata]|uniref:uncharacterized protein LOC141879385 isoform X2 n=1 Tax=Acropora palmata TaxID=6131 RepID=UPI003DA18291
MSEVTFKTLLFRIDNRLEEINASKDGRVRGHVLFMCNEKIAHRDDDTIPSLLNKMKENGLLGVDSLQMLKGILKAEDEWDFLDEIVKFENIRGEYKKLLEKVISALEKPNDLGKVTSIVWRRLDVAEEKRNGVRDVRSLVQVLEEMNFIGVDCLNVLMEFSIELNDDDLQTELKEFQNRRTKEEKTERRKAQVAAVWCFAGAVCQKIVGAIKVHCTTQNLKTGLPLAVRITDLLRKSSTVEEFAEGFQQKILPEGTKLLAISEESVCFMVQGETSLALVELYKRYSSGRLQKDLQEFLVTDDIRELADTEVVVLVRIDEKEFSEALVDLGKEDQASSKQKDELPEQMDMLSEGVDMVSEKKVDKVLLSLEGKVAPAVEKEAEKDEKDICPEYGKITDYEIKELHYEENVTEREMDLFIAEEMRSGIAKRGEEEMERLPESSEEDKTAREMNLFTAEKMRSGIAKRGKVSARTVRGSKRNKKNSIQQ